MSASEGRIFQILNGSAVDGPGLRQVVFLAGCNLTCPFCHNIDAIRSAGKPYTPAELFAVTLRQRPYFGGGGGVTLSGGEPFLQAEFCTEFFRLCKKEGIHTALETNGTLRCDALVKESDLIIADIKNQFLTPDRENLKRFVALGAELWLTNVVIRGVNDTPDHFAALTRLAREVGAKRLKFLPLKRLCLEKYAALGLHFPFDVAHEPLSVPDPVCF